MKTMTMRPGKATIIWQQVPAGVRMSLGARQPVGDENKGYLQFTVGPSKGEVVFKVTIRLEPSDTYTVKLIRCDLRTGEAADLESASDVYCDQLGELLLRWEGRHLVS
jgi:hypothetical protein